MSWKPPYRSLNPDGAITKVAPGPRLVSVQYLRAVAAMMVVVHHAVNQLAPAQPRPTFLEAGVDMFFVISGLVIWLKVAERPENAGKFMLDRLFRIAPLYWLLTTAVLGVMAFAPRLLQSTHTGLAHSLASYAFVAWPAPGSTGALRPLIVPGWTLNYEVYFYGLVALALLLPKAIRTRTMVLSLAALAAGGGLVAGFGPVAAFYTSPIIIEFAAGILVAVAMRSRARPSPSVALLLLILASVTLVAGSWAGQGDGLRLIQLGVPAASFVVALVALERGQALPRLAGLERVGDASYAIYLSHTLLLSALGQVWRRLGLTVLPGPFFVAVALVAALGAGWALHIGFERPVAAWFVRRRKRALAPRVALALPEPAP